MPGMAEPLSQNMLRGGTTPHLLLHRPQRLQVLTDHARQLALRLLPPLRLLGGARLGGLNLARRLGQPGPRHLCLRLYLCRRRLGGLQLGLRSLRALLGRRRRRRLLGGRLRRRLGLRLELGGAGRGLLQLGLQVLGPQHGGVQLSAALLQQGAQLGGAGGGSGGLLQVTGRLLPQVPNLPLHVVDPPVLVRAGERRRDGAGW